MTYPALKNKAQKVFNCFIRDRDKDLGCISCGGSVDHAGHYLSQGHNSMVRFNEINVNGQCIRCNSFLHGNFINYRFGLIKKYGIEKVELLELNQHKIKKWTAFELGLIISVYGK